MKGGKLGTIKTEYIYIYIKKVKKFKWNIYKGHVPKSTAKKQCFIIYIIRNQE